MNKSSSKIILIILLMVFISIPIITISLLDLKQKEKNESIYKKLLAEQRAQKEVARKAEEKIYLMGKFDPSKRENFVPVPVEYNVSGYKMYLRKETLDAFLKMQNAANLDDIDLKIASATRNFIYQKGLWNNKWNGLTLVDGKNLSISVPDGLERFKKILEYSAVPGTSRHHFGTDIDINNANLSYFDTEQGEKEYDWLVKNAENFGFCQPYDLKDNDRSEGYNEEKWHWSYLPLAKTFTQEYKNLITESDIKGFDGDEYVSNLDLINDYVLGINPDCI